MSSSNLRRVVYALGTQLNRTHKVSVKKRTINDSYNNNFEPYSEYQIEDFDFDEINSYLSFQIIRYTYKPKIERYITINYERNPVYSPEKSVTTKCMKKFSKSINLKAFCEVQILKERFVDDFEINVEIRKDICDLLGYKPRWLLILNKIDESNDEIERLKEDFQKFIPTKYSYRPKLKDEPSNLFIRLFFLPFTLGLSFIGFISKKRASINKKKNLQIDKWNLDHKNNIDKLNKKESSKIDAHNNELVRRIKYLTDKIKKLEFDMTNFKPQTDTNGWTDIRESFLFDNNDLKGMKGVYIIWNKNNNKYYVGQTKDLYSRIFTQHFDRKNHCPKNYLFFSDWDKGNKFYYRVEKVDTKDELDRLEKKYIEEYDSFRNGYNSTSGNK